MRVLLAIIVLCRVALSADGYLFVESSFDPNERWINFSQEEDLSIKNLIQHLAKSTSGRDLLLMAKKKASKRGMTLSDVIKAGSGSLTDTTLIRKFSPDSPEHIVYETKSVVYINRSLNQYDALLDLAHELTHFVYRRDFNPYKSGFSMAEFIKNTIEGKGGEVQAFVKECQVLKELFPSKYNDRYNCGKIIDPSTGKISYQLAVARFYQLGQFEEAFRGMLIKEGIENAFPEVSEGEVSFVSSAYGVPYPVAAYREYKSVMSKVCANDKRRMAYVSKSKSGRTPASSNSLLAKCQAFD